MSPNPLAVGAGGVVHEVVSRLLSFTLPVAQVVPVPGLSQGVSRPDPSGIDGVGAVTWFTGPCLHAVPVWKALELG